MAIHSIVSIPNSGTLVDEDVCSYMCENLIVAKTCLDGLDKKKYGFPALVLIMSVIDSIGAYFENGTQLPLSGHTLPMNTDFSKKMKSLHFVAFYNGVTANNWGGKYLKDIIKKFPKSSDFVDKLCRPYRNRSTHTNILEENHFIVKSSRSKYVIYKEASSFISHVNSTGTTISNGINVTCCYLYLEPLYNFTKLCFEQLMASLNIPIPQRYSIKL